jgi:outer membrane protein OmpA-like peptidoglycan-associated protein
MRHADRSVCRAVVRRAAIVVVGLGALLGVGCGGDTTADDLARLTGERDALKEAIERDKAALARTPEAAPTPNPQAGWKNSPNEVTPQDDGYFGPGTTTRHDSGDLVVEVAGDVLFDSGSVTLKATAKKTLDTVARRIKGDYSGHTIRVEGYTDSDPLNKTKGKYKDNEELSAQRALAVERYLVSKGVSSRDVYSAAFGPAKPKGSKKASRRVEIVILGVR